MIPRIPSSPHRTLALLAAALTCLNACSPPDPHSSPVKSRFFDRVEIIGSRGTGLGQFNKPRSLALDRDDNLYVVDMTGRVQKFSPNGHYLDYWQMPVTDLGKPKGMDRDHHGNIVVLEPHYSRVNHFSPAGQLVEQWGRHGTNSGLLTFPRAVAVTPHGDVFVSEYGVTERVQRFNATNRALSSLIGSNTPAYIPFNRPEGLGLDRLGRLYVADSCNHRIQIFDPHGNFLRAHGHPGIAPGQFSYPYDVRVDAHGYQYVCEFGNSRIQILDSHDRPIEILGSPGHAPGQFNNPWAIALDSHGNLYVADSLNHRVQKLIARRQSPSTSSSSTAPNLAASFHLPSRTATRSP